MTNEFIAELGLTLVGIPPRVLPIYDCIESAIPHECYLNALVYFIADPHSRLIAGEIEVPEGTLMKAPTGKFYRARNDQWMPHNWLQINGVMVETSHIEMLNSTRCKRRWKDISDYITRDVAKDWLEEKDFPQISKLLKRRYTK